MTNRTMEQLLGSDDRDPGCDGAFELLDQYADAVRRGEDAAQRFPEFVTHIRHCAACREDAEGLVAVLGELQPPSDEV